MAAQLAAAKEEKRRLAALTRSMSGSELASALGVPSSGSGSASLLRHGRVDLHRPPAGLLKLSCRTVALTSSAAVLRGVGRHIGKLLRAAGVHTLQQLAELKPRQRQQILKDAAIVTAASLFKLEANAQESVQYICQRLKSAAAGMQQQPEAAPRDGSAQLQARVTQLQAQLTAAAEAESELRQQMGALKAQLQAAHERAAAASKHVAAPLLKPGAGLSSLSQAAEHLSCSLSLRLCEVEAQVQSHEEQLEALDMRLAEMSDAPAEGMQPAPEATRQSVASQTNLHFSSAIDTSVPFQMPRARVQTRVSAAAQDDVPPRSQAQMRKAAWEGQSPAPEPLPPLSRRPKLKLPPLSASAQAQRILPPRLAQLARPHSLEAPAMCISMQWHANSAGESASDGATESGVDFHVGDSNSPCPSPGRLLLPPARAAAPSCSSSSAGSSDSSEAEEDEEHSPSGLSLMLQLSSTRVGAASSSHGPAPSSTMSARGLALQLEVHQQSDYSDDFEEASDAGEASDGSASPHASGGLTSGRGEPATGPPSGCTLALAALPQQWDAYDGKQPTPAAIAHDQAQRERQREEGVGPLLPTAERPTRADGQSQAGASSCAHLSIAAKPAQQPPPALSSQLSPASGRSNGSSQHSGEWHML